MPGVIAPTNSQPEGLNIMAKVGIPSSIRAISVIRGEMKHSFLHNLCIKKPFL